MPGLVRTYETLAREARDANWTYEEYLHEVLTAELSSRAESAVRQRIRDARFPEQKTLEGFDFKVAEGVDVAQVSRLGCCEWVKKAENVILAGPIGTGKTHLATAWASRPRSNAFTSLSCAPRTSSADSLRRGTRANSAGSSAA